MRVLFLLAALSVPLWSLTEQPEADSCKPFKGEELLSCQDTQVFLKKAKANPDAAGPIPSYVKMEYVQTQEDQMILLKIAMKNVGQLSGRR